MSSTNAAKIGSISHGTLRDCDLLYNFAVELTWLTGDDLYCSRMYDVLDESRLEVLPGCEEKAQDLLQEFVGKLEELAPAYCQFGANEGDGSDFGFWPDLASVEELPKFNDLADVPEVMEEDYCVVNDHGNVSVYAASGELIWDCV